MSIVRPTTGLIIAVTLPPALEELRQVGSPAARLGCPAHLTLLYPFVEPSDSDQALHSTIRDVVRSHAQFPYMLTRLDRWPGTVYLAPEPAEPFVALQRDLSDAFPRWPIYEGRFAFEPHVSLVDEVRTDPPETDEDSMNAWFGRAEAAAHGLLPIGAMAVECLLIAPDRRGRWRTSGRYPLRTPGGI